MGTEIIAIGPIVSNGGLAAISAGLPYAARVTITGTADILFHAWNVEAVAEKASAAKGSKAKKTDNLESYVYRDENGELAIPGVYFRQSLIEAAKYQQDPRSPRKSAKDLFKAGLVPLTHRASLGVSAWDYEDKQRVVIQQSGVTRVRPALKRGWKATFDLMILLPEDITTDRFYQALGDAGRLVGLADYRPTYGRFIATSIEIVSPDAI